jgi:hypothetical protein
VALLTAGDILESTCFQLNDANVRRILRFGYLAPAAALRAEP